MKDYKVKSVKWELDKENIDGPDDLYIGTIEDNNVFELFIERHNDFFITTVCTPDYLILDQKGCDTLVESKEYIQNYINNHINSFLEIDDE